MNSKESILSNIRKNSCADYEMPNIAVEAVRYGDSLQQFIDMTKAVGGNAHVISLVMSYMYRRGLFMGPQNGVILLTVSVL